MATNTPILGKSTERFDLETLASHGPVPLSGSDCTKEKVDYYRHGLQNHSQHARPTTRGRKAQLPEDNPFGALCTWIVDHQLGISMNLLLLLSLTHICFPRARQHTRKFFDLSYYNHETGRYALGGDDIYLVFNWVIVLTGLRVACMEYIFMPFAEGGGINKKKEKVRFAEQAWIFVYYTVFWTLGMYIMYHTDYWLNLRSMWTNWPDREMNGLFKWYYLVQFAFYLQQILVVNIEERRKDFWQMFIHHLVTSALIFCSYAYHYTNVGNVILCIMDAVDIILTFAKMLKYLKYQLACDIAFGVFLVVWFISRHVIYIAVLYSIVYHVPEEMPYGCWKGTNNDLEGLFQQPITYRELLVPFKDPQGIICFNGTVWTIFFGMLLFLQAILLLWFAMIVRVASKVIRGQEAEDSRSDDEGEGNEDEDVKKVSGGAHNEYLELPPLEEEVGIEAINLSIRRSSPARVFRKSGATSSGVTLPHDRKELLGRIGCDKGS